MRLDTNPKTKSGRRNAFLLALHDHAAKHALGVLERFDKLSPEARAELRTVLETAYTAGTCAMIDALEGRKSF